jgi:SAM-dependent methyltransferase
MAESSKFDTLASAYAKSRPTYPDALFDAVRELSGRALSGARIADVGAGTGISSRQLRERGARVTAVDLSEPMLRQLLAGSPGVGAVLGSANALPLRDGSVDFVTFAQSWHWVNPDLAVPEVLRVLKPGGALACFWNTPTVGAPWRLGYNDRIRELIGGDPGYGNDSTALDHEPRLDLGEQWSHLPVQVFETPWSRRVTLEERITNVMSRSYVSDVTPERLETFLDNERAVLLKHFPDGMVLEEYTTWLGVVVSRP